MDYESIQIVNTIKRPAQPQRSSRTCPGTSGYTKYRGADKSTARPRRKQTTATEDFDVRITYL
jgi:hypothetical protein